MLSKLELIRRFRNVPCTREGFRSYLESIDNGTTDEDVRNVIRATRKL